MKASVYPETCLLRLCSMDVCLWIVTPRAVKELKWSFLLQRTCTSSSSNNLYWTTKKDSLHCRYNVKKYPTLWWNYFHTLSLTLFLYTSISLLYRRHSFSAPENALHLLAWFSSHTHKDSIQLLQQVMLLSTFSLSQAKVQQLNSCNPSGYPQISLLRCC